MPQHATEGLATQDSQDLHRQFERFFKQSVGFVGAIVSGIPVLTSYLDVVPAPHTAHHHGEKAISILVTVFAASIFLTLFWFKDRVDTKQYISGGWCSMAAGAAGILFYMSVTDDDGLTVDVLKQVLAGEQLHVLLYFVSFVLLLGGCSAIFIWGFQRTRARLQSVAELLPQLDPAQFVDVTEYIRTLVDLNATYKASKLSQGSKHALQLSAAFILREYKRILNELNRGVLEIRGPEMDELYEYFLAGVERSFVGLSLDDLAYWVDEDRSGKYLASNQRLLDEKDRSIERIFLLEQRNLSKSELDALERQMNMGVKVRIAMIPIVVAEVARRDELDFGVFDDFAVSSWKFGANHNRIFRVLTSRQDVERHRLIVESVRKYCEFVPGRDRNTSDSKTFKTREELALWAATSSDVLPSMTRSGSFN